MLNLSPVELAKQAAASRNSDFGPQIGFLKLEDGEPKVIRLLTAFKPAYVVSHSCGMRHVDIDKESFDAAMQRGEAFPCPNCGAPLTQSDIEAERPIVEGAYMHRFIQTSDANKKANFVCCGHPQNALMDIIETDDSGAPKYPCPICASTDKNGDHPKTNIRLYGVAVEREVKIEIQNVNGIQTPVVVGTRDVVEVGDDGVERPKVVIVDLPYQSFWSKLYDISPDFSLSICYFDWQITRTGSGLDTKYTVNRLKDIPEAVDFAPYKDMMPDIKGMLRAWGKPKYYNDRGWAVHGYVPETSVSEGTAAAAAAFAGAQPLPTGFQPQTTTTSWSQISNAIGQ